MADTQDPLLIVQMTHKEEIQRLSAQHQEFRDLLILSLGVHVELRRQLELVEMEMRAHLFFKSSSPRLSFLGTVERILNLAKAKHCQVMNAILSKVILGTRANNQLPLSVIEQGKHVLAQIRTEVLNAPL